MTFHPIVSRAAWLGWCLLAVALVSPRTSWAQATYGEIRVQAVASGEEISAQPDLWVCEVYFKPMRLIAVDVTNPKTGRKESKFVWYTVYRAINRPLIAPKADNPPVNEFDPPVLPPRFIPEFTLVTVDGDEPRVYHDVVIPEALAAINRREGRNYASSVGVVADVPAAVKSGSPDEKFLYGVAMFTDVDPDADLYTVFMTGFSNGMKVCKSPDGTPVVLHKMIEVRYWRPGDRFSQQEPEIRLDTRDAKARKPRSTVNVDALDGCDLNQADTDEPVRWTYR
ncbi:hypothetical protein GC163_18835 [bacterium]|nr:hypothetical protein [bacterium]